MRDQNRRQTDAANAAQGSANDPWHHGGSARDSLRILKRREVEAQTGLKKTSIYDGVRDGSFPPPVPLTGKQSVGWIQGEIDQWIKERIAARDAKGSR